MEIVHSTSAFSWDHETSTGYMIAPPEMIPVLDEYGDPLVADDGEPVMTPPSDWVPTQEAVEVDTIILVDRSSQELVNVYKFSFTKTDLANFIGRYTTLLDAEGRRTVRNALEQSSGIVIAGPGPLRAL